VGLVREAGRSQRGALSVDFEEQRAERKRNGSGTLIRNRDYTNRAGGGERRETGRIREVDFPAGNRVEHFDPEGNEKPQRGVEIRGEAGIAGQDSGNGIAVLISPEPGLTGASEGIVIRTGLGRAW